jgi:hypothetical protein
MTCLLNVWLEIQINVYNNYEMKVINPETNKLISIHGKTAKQLLKKHYSKTIKLNRKTLAILKHACQKGGDGDEEEANLEIVVSIEQFLMDNSDAHGNIICNENFKNNEYIIQHIQCGGGCKLEDSQIKIIEDQIIKFNKFNNNEKLTSDIIIPYIRDNSSFWKEKNTDSFINAFHYCSISIFKQICSLQLSKTGAQLDKDLYKLIPYISIDIYSNKAKSTYIVNNWKRVVDGKTIATDKPKNVVESCNILEIMFSARL